MNATISVRFPAGRYHATPWDRLVNEAEIEWPPSPWRILRALIATWHRKIDVEEYPEPLLIALLEVLSRTRPVYQLPPLTKTHTRHYMPVSAGQKSLVFDGFARMDPHEPLVVSWRGIELGELEKALLARLVHLMGYLGRAESWIEAEVLEGYEGPFNCAAVNPEHADSDPAREPVRLLTPKDAGQYASWRMQMIAELALDAKRLSKQQKRALTLMPERFVDALRIDTTDMREGGWNMPPAADLVTYLRPVPSEAPRIRRRTNDRPPMTTVRLALGGKPLPRIEDAVRIGETVRAAAIHRWDRLHPGTPVPPAISGHDVASATPHGHAFYLPEDADGDGFIDHMLIYAPSGLSPDEVRTLASIRRLWIGNEGEWKLVYEGCWLDPFESRSKYAGHSRYWISVTPYLHPWFSKRGFGVEQQIRRECEQRGLHVIEVRQHEVLSVAGRERRPIHFRRFRSKHGMRQPDRRGSIVQIVFAEPLAGPLALGFGCHFGLGMFAPAHNEPTDE